jgi:hypothetical protein
VTGIEAKHHDELTHLSATATKLKGALLRSTGDNTALLGRYKVVQLIELCVLTIQTIVVLRLFFKLSSKALAVHENCTFGVCMYCSELTVVCVVHATSTLDCVLVSFTIGSNSVAHY